jgi:hypothetical protein
MSLRDKACPFLTLVQSETNPAIVEFREGTTISYKGDVRYGRVREPRDGEVYSSVLYGEYTEDPCPMVGCTYSKDVVTRTGISA